MIFLITSHFRNTHPTLGDQITRLSKPGTDPLQYDAGDFISIGRDTAGNELSAGAITKMKGHKIVQLIGHLNQGGRLLDPLTQQNECAKALTEGATMVKKQIKALITEKRLLDEDIEKDEIAAVTTRIQNLQVKQKALLKLAADIVTEDGPKNIIASLSAKPVAKAA